MDDSISCGLQVGHGYRLFLSTYYSCERGSYTENIYISRDILQFGCYKKVDGRD